MGQLPLKKDLWVDHILPWVGTGKLPLNKELWIGHILPFVGTDKLPLNKDVWVGHILPFVGMGNFVFVAGTCKEMKEYYKAYCATVENPPLLAAGLDGETAPVTNVDTFYSVAYSSLSCARYWNSHFQQQKYEWRRVRHMRWRERRRAQLRGYLSY